MYYNLDVIISVGYRVKSIRGIQFRKWANRILKDFMVKGYAINQNRFDLTVPDNALLKLLDNAKLDGNLLLDAEQMIGFLKRYVKALRLLDEFDHRTIEKPIGREDIYVVTYEECKTIIAMSSFKETSEHFAIEKDDSFQSSINVIYQTFGGEDCYPTLEEKAANLLYLITKNHSFIDGNKRIAAIVFLCFLDKNNALFKNRNKIIDDDTLVTLTILIASSNPIDKEIIVNLIMTFLVK